MNSNHKPVAHVQGDRVAVYVGATFEVMTQEAALQLYDFLGDTLVVLGTIKHHGTPVELLPGAYPPALTKELRDILGMPNFVAGSLVPAFRLNGQVIPHKAEEEQAFIIDWMLRLYLVHGASWRQQAILEMDVLTGRRPA